MGVFDFVSDIWDNTIGAGLDAVGDFLGGDQKISVIQDQKPTIDVTSAPKIDVYNQIDFSPIKEALEQLSESSKKTLEEGFKTLTAGAILSSLINRQTEIEKSSLEMKKEQIQAKGLLYATAEMKKTLILISTAGLIIWAFRGRK